MSSTEIITITTTDTDEIIGKGFLFSLFALYFLIVAYFAFIATKPEYGVRQRAVGTNATPTDFAPIETENFSKTWNSFSNTPYKKAFIYILIIIIVLYALYSVYLIVIGHNDPIISSSLAELKNMRFWEENFYFSFAFSLGLFVPGLYLNRDPLYSYALVIFIFNVLFNVLWQVTGFFDSLYTTKIAELKCKVVDGTVNINDCATDPVNNRSPSYSLIIYKYMFLFVLLSSLILPTLPNIMQGKSGVPGNQSASDNQGTSDNQSISGNFHFMDVLYLGLTNGIVVLLAIHYINFRRGGTMLHSYESAMIIFKFIIFHLGLRFAGLL
jgi:hypothetical protein